ncbi:Prefoldin [Trichophaea hybrida]|nr:Prefoldin [Trichophaea hybrida]
MSIPNEALQKLMQDIESKAAFSQQQLTIVKAQIAAKQRDVRLLQLTGKELEKLPPGTRSYESVGKMFVQEDITNIQRRLAKEEAGLKGDIKDLEKKHTYLETTYLNAQGGLNAILKGGR